MIIHDALNVQLHPKESFHLENSFQLSLIKQISIIKQGEEEDIKQDYLYLQTIFNRLQDDRQQMSPMVFQSIFVID
jgi:hypothetical protein